MKKSLSLTLATAMVFTTFSSVAFAADEASMDAQAKFDALKELGIFEGYSDGTAGLDKEMTRAEYAAVLVRMLGLEKSSGTSSYTDVSDHWGHTDGYIEAVTKAKIMEGPADGIFDPDGKVTKEQLATIMVRALNLQVDADAEVEGDVSDWAKGYVAAAVKAGLIANDTDFTGNATREILVNSTYVANQQKPPVNGKIGITEAKATGAAKITVKLNGAVDTEAAKVDVKLNGNTVTLKETVWSNDKRSVDLVFDKKFMANTYQVALSGISNLDDARATAEVKTEDEVITKIDFVTASDTLPQAKEVRIDFKVMNQYGEDSGKKASDLDIRVGGRIDWNTISGESAIKLDLDGRDSTRSEYPNYVRRDDRIDITITEDDSRVSVNKFFTVGDEQRVSKIEVGKVLDLAGKEITSVDKGDTGYLQVVAYDQYGFRVIDSAILGDIRLSARDIDPLGTVDSERDERRAFVDSDVDQDSIPEMRFKVDEDADAGEQTITLYSAGSSASKVVMIGAPSEPATIEFGVASLTLAENDGSTGTNGWNSEESNSVLYTRHVPVILKDENGKQLTKDEIVKAYTGTGTVKSKIRVNDSGSVRATMEESGAFKGQLKLSVGREGSGSIEVSLYDKPEVKATMNVRVGKERQVDDIAMTSNNGDKGIVIDGMSAQAKFKFKAYDQYNDEARDNAYSDKYVAQIEYRAVSEQTGDTLFLPKGIRYVNAETGTANDVMAATVPTADQSFEFTNVTKSVYVPLGDLFDRELKVVGGTTGNTYTVKAKLLKKNDSGNWVEADSVTKTYEVIDATNKSLTFSAYLDKAIDEGGRTKLQALTKTSLEYSTGVSVASKLISGVASDLKDLADKVGKAGKEIKITAKDGSTTILLPDYITESVTSSNSNVAVGGVKNNTTDPTKPGEKGYVFGVEKGEANVTVKFKTNKPGVSQTASLAVITKEDSMNITKFAPKKVSVVRSESFLESNKIFDIPVLDELVATEGTYGNTFSKADFNTYGALLGIDYIVVEKQDANDILTVDRDGTVAITDDSNAGGSFTIKVVAPSGVEQLLELGFTPST